MAVLVTGGAGYIGTHMVWELLDVDEDVVVLDWLSTGFEWAVAPEARLVIGDVGDACRAGDQATVMADSERARREFGWAPRLHDLDAIIESSLNWEQALLSKNVDIGQPRLRNTA